jgi:hypothetical protein
MEEPTQYQLTILQALQQRPIYYGTVPQNVIDKRRVKNKMQKASRKANRGA